VNFLVYVLIIKVYSLLSNETVEYYRGRVVDEGHIMLKYDFDSRANAIQIPLCEQPYVLYRYTNGFTILWSFRILQRR
jgi:hypothetical protein